jgi:hypothetical protein
LEDYQQAALAQTWDWTFEESVRLGELAWRFDCRFPIIKGYFPEHTKEQLLFHYARMERAFSQSAAPSQKPKPTSFLNDPWILHLRRNLDIIVAERERIIKTFAAPLLYQHNSSLPDILQKNLNGRRRKTDASNAAPKTPSHKKASGSDTPKNVVRSVQAVNPKPLQREVLLASEMHWKGIKPSVVKQVEKRMLELGIPLRPVIPSERMCDIYRNLVMRLSSEVEQTKRRN